MTANTVNTPSQPTSPAAPSVPTQPTPMPYKPDNSNSGQAGLIDALKSSMGKAVGTMSSLSTSLSSSTSITAIRIDTDDTLEAINQSTQQILNGLNIINRSISNNNDKIKNEILAIIKSDKKAIGASSGIALRRITEIEAMNKLYDRRIADLDNRMKVVEMQLSSMSSSNDKDDLEGEYGFPPTEIEPKSAGKGNKRKYSSTTAIAALQLRQSAHWGAAKKTAQGVAGVATVAAAGAAAGIGAGSAASIMGGGNGVYNPKDYADPNRFNGDVRNGETVRNTPTGFGGSKRDPGEQQPSTGSLNDINANQLAFIRGIGATESDFSRKEAYSESLNKAGNNSNVRKYGQDGADYGYYQTNALDVKDAIRRGVDPEIAKHLNGGGRGGESTVEQQTLAMHEYLKRKHPAIYDNLKSGSPEAFEAARAKMAGQWFGLKDAPHKARKSWAGGDLNPGEIMPGLQRENVQSSEGEKFGFTTNKPYSKEEIDGYLKQVKSPGQLTLGLNPDYGAEDGSFQASYNNIKEKGINFHLYDQGAGDEKFKYSDGSNESKLMYDKNGNRIDHNKRLFERIDQYKPKSYEVDNTGTGKKSLDEHMAILSRAKEKGISSQLVAKNLTPDERAQLAVMAKAEGLDHLLAPNSIYETGDKDAKAAYDQSKSSKSGFILSNDTRKYQTNQLEDVPSSNKPTIASNAIPNESTNTNTAQKTGGNTNNNTALIAKKNDILNTPIGGLPPVGDTNSIRYNRISSTGVHPSMEAGNIVPVNTPFGSIKVHKTSATAFQGFYTDLAEVGAPINKLGSYNVRQKRAWLGGKGWSEHSFGNATDIDDAVGFSPKFKKWLVDNPGAFDEIKKKWGMKQGIANDPNHVEFGGIISPKAAETIAIRNGSSNNANGNNKNNENTPQKVSTDTSVQRRGFTNREFQEKVTANAERSAEQKVNDAAIAKVIPDADATPVKPKAPEVVRDLEAADTVAENDVSGTKTADAVQVPETPTPGLKEADTVAENDVSGVEAAKAKPATATETGTGNSGSKSDKPSKPTYTGNEHNEGSNMSSSGYGSGQQSKDGPAFCNI
jgi:hypothetical protein